MERLLNKELEEKIRTLPKDPGVYLMKDQGGNVIYVGKARNLSNRVRQYFGALSGKQAKVAAMVQHIHTFDYIIADSEKEARSWNAISSKSTSPIIISSCGMTSISPMSASI